MINDDQPDNYLNSEEIEAARHEGDNPGEIKFTSDDTVDENGATVAAPRRRRRRRYFAVFIVIVVAALAVAGYLRYFNPYITDAQATGYVTGVECRGFVFKTFEGELIPAAPANVEGVYSRDFKFSVENDSLARRLQEYQAARMPVTLLYERYPATVPWRGASTVVVTGVKPAPTPGIVPGGEAGENR